VSELPIPSAADFEDKWGIVILDTETTGLGKDDRIIQLAARIVYADGVSGSSDNFDRLVNPGHTACTIFNFSVQDRCTRIGKQKYFEQVALHFFSFIQNSFPTRFLMYAHNAVFDRQILTKELDNTYKD